MFNKKLTFCKVTPDKMNLVTKENIHIAPLKTDLERDKCAQIMKDSEPWKSLEFSFNKLIENLNDRLSEVYVMHHKTEVIGLVIIQLKGPLSGYIKSIAIAPTWRNKNLGKLLIDHVEQIIFRTSPNVFLCVSSFNPGAKRFYVDNGYEYIGELKNYVVDGYSELLMRKTTGPINEFEAINNQT